MTCIAAFIKRGVAYVGADSAVSYGPDHVTVQSGNKLVVKGPLLIAVSGAVRTEQALHYQFTPTSPAKDEDPKAYLVRTFVPELRDCLRSNGITEEKGEMDSALVVAFHGHMFDIGPDYSVTTPDDGLIAIGTGYRLALGALHATNNMRLPANKRMHRALEAAAHFDKSCLPPYFMGVSYPNSLHVIAL